MVGVFLWKKLSCRRVSFTCTLRYVCVCVCVYSQSCLLPSYCVNARFNLTSAVHINIVLVSDVFPEIIARKNGKREKDEERRGETSTILGTAAGTTIIIKAGEGTQSSNSSQKSKEKKTSNAVAASRKSRACLLDMTGSLHEKFDHLSSPFDKKKKKQVFYSINKYYLVAQMRMHFSISVEKRCIDFVHFSFFRSLIRLSKKKKNSFFFWSLREHLSLIPFLFFFVQHSAFCSRTHDVYEI